MKSVLVHSLIKIVIHFSVFFMSQCVLPLSINDADDDDDDDDDDYSSFFSDSEY